MARGTRALQIISVAFDYEDAIMRITSKGQVTIPIEVRKKAGLLPNTEVEFVVRGNTVIIKKAEKTLRRGRRVLTAMRGKATKRFSTDEIMALTRGN